MTQCFILLITSALLISGCKKPPPPPPPEPPVYPAEYKKGMDTSKNPGQYIVSYIAECDSKKQLERTLNVIMDDYSYKDDFVSITILLYQNKDDFGEGLDWTGTLESSVDDMPRITYNNTVLKKYEIE